MIGCGGGGGNNNASAPPAAIGVSVTPPTTSLSINQNQVFSAVVSNSANQAVTWTVQEQNGGSITTAGSYTAPSIAGTYHVIAVSQADSTKSAQAAVTVSAPSPTFTSVPSSTAAEATLYTYAVAATDPAQTAITFSLTSAPSGAVFSGNTISWRPNSIQARTSNNFTITATTAAGGSALQNWQVTPTGIINGLRVIDYISDSGVASAPDDTSKFTIEALVPNGSGGYTTLPGTGNASGTFQIPGVPAGSYWLHHGVGYFWTSSSNIDSGYANLGLPNPTVSATGTSIQVTSVNLSPISSSDLFEAYAADTDDLEYGNFPQGSVGATSTTVTIDPFYVPRPTDPVYLTQLSPSAANANVLVASTVCGPEFLNVANGFVTNVTCPFSAVPIKNTVRVAVAVSQFAQMQSGVNPNATPYFSNYFVDAMPMGTSRGIVGSTPDLLMNANTLGSTDIDLGNVSFGNPYPSTWTLFGGFQGVFAVTYTLPNTTSSTTVYASNEAFSTLPTASAPISPLIGTVQNATIAGASFASNQSGIGTTPTVQWAAPSLGTSNGYVLGIHKLVPSGNQLQDQLVANLYTTSTTLNIPPNVLVAGSSYYFRLSAVSNGNINMSTAPYRKGFPYGLAQTLSGLIAP